MAMQSLSCGDIIKFWVAKLREDRQNSVVLQSRSICWLFAKEQKKALKGKPDRNL